MTTATQYVLRPYVYHDGKQYQPNVKVIRILDPQGGYKAVVGGVIEMKGKVLAFASRSGKALVISKIADIIEEADAYAWGATKREAVEKIRSRLSR